MMCVQCSRRAQGSAALAKYFREKSEETVLREYIDILKLAAEDLENICQYFTSKCRCGEKNERQYTPMDAQVNGSAFLDAIGRH